MGKNQGRLVADFYCCILEVDASLMAQSLRSYTHAFNSAALFGRALIDGMVQSASALSDVVTVCIILHKTPRRRSSIQADGDGCDLGSTWQSTELALQDTGNTLP